MLSPLSAFLSNADAKIMQDGNCLQLFATVYELISAFLSNADTQVMQDGNCLQLFTTVYNLYNVDQRSLWRDIYRRHYF